MRQLLTDEFISKYPNYPSHMSSLGKFVYLRTYSRYIKELGRRETWKETVRRAVEYNVGLGVKHMKKIGYKPNYKKFRKEAEELFDSIFNLKQFLSGRTFWIGGSASGVEEKFPLANFNCSFLEVTSYDDFCDLFYVLMLGTGGGFRCTKEDARNLPPIRTDVKVVSATYKPVPPEERLETTTFKRLDNGHIKIYIGDSKEGWVEALRMYFNILTKKEYDDIHTIKFSYNSVRPAGERLKTFGGTASGHEPLKAMFEGIDKVLKNEMDGALEPLEIAYEYKNADGDVIVRKRVRPIHALDIGNLIGNNVVSGGVRRTAEIFLMDADDFECMFAKYGLWGIYDETRHKEIIKGLRKFGQNKIADYLESLPLNDMNARNVKHRSVSNNSIAFDQKPERDLLNFIFGMMQNEGEPAFINLESANERRPNVKGLNPCAEVLLDSYGTCNLTTMNITAFIEDATITEKDLDIMELYEAQKRSVRAGLRMTLVELELPHWNATQQRDRLLGVSMTGYQDAMDIVGYNGHQQRHLLRELRRVANEEAVRYAKEMRVSVPLLVTTVKPEGTLSQVAGGVSSGLHYSHSPYFIRRIRISKNDPLAKTVKILGWHVEEDITNPSTCVVSFPVYSGAKQTKDDIKIEKQFDNYFMFQECYTDQNSSNTMHVRSDEWDKAEEIVWDNWDRFIGVSFLSYDSNTYPQAPYEACTKEEYEELLTKMVNLDDNVLKYYDNDIGSDLDDSEGCKDGACSVR